MHFAAISIDVSIFVDAENILIESLKLFAEILERHFNKQSLSSKSLINSYLPQFSLAATH